MTIQLGQTVQIQTPTGVTAGRVVGTEERDVSRNGSGRLEQFVCVAIADPRDEWKWFPIDEVTA